MPLDFDELGVKIKEDIRREKHGVSEKSGFQGEASTGDAFLDMKRQHPGQQIYALVVEVRCPWGRCSTPYFIAKFVTKKMGEGFFFYCHQCQTTPITLRDYTNAHGQNTFPVEILKRQMDKYPGRYERWMNMLKTALERYQEFVKKQPNYRERELVPESSHHRSISMRMSVVDDDDEDAGRRGVTIV